MVDGIFFFFVVNIRESRCILRDLMVPSLSGSLRKLANGSFAIVRETRVTYRRVSLEINVGPVSKNMSRSVGVRCHNALWRVVVVVDER